MSSDAADLAHRLAREADAVCRHYLSNGRRAGRYWLVGDVANTPGRSLYVRLSEGGTGASGDRGGAGKWTDAATGDHGDLLDLIALRLGHIRLRDTLDEARAFLALPRLPPDVSRRGIAPPAPRGSPEAARRLFAMSQPIVGTLAETYLRRRGITVLDAGNSLRFHPRCYYRPDDESPKTSWPALIAAVSDLAGAITGAHRTYLDPTLGSLHPPSRRKVTDDGKAPIETPRRAMGRLLGHGVRFDMANDVMAAGEGIETMLSLRCVAPALPMVAALSAAHLAALTFPPTLRRLYIVRDDDPAGERAMMRLSARADAVGIEVCVLSPQLDDFNADLRAFGADGLRVAVQALIAAEDVDRFIACPI